MANNTIDQNLFREVEKLGAKDMNLCMQCGNCAAACPLSSGTNTFPRRIYRYLQLGLKDKLLESPEPWLCYYCGDCNTDCPRGAEPAETMMATRRWLTTQFDWTGLARLFYSSPKWQVAAFFGVTLGIVLLFLFGHGPVITDRVALNSFAPPHWVHIGDQIMFVILGALLISNGFRMYLGIMQGTKIPITTYITQAPVFLLHYLTQKRWRKCGTGPSSRWMRHFFLFSGYIVMEIFIIGFLDVFQTDIVHPFWHPTRIFGYYATIALMLMSGNMLYSRWYLKEEKLHRYSDFTDVFFLILLFVSAFTGILVHIFRLAGWPVATYTIYSIHVGIVVGMLSIMLPFGKLSHLFYRPLAIFLTTLKEKIVKESQVDFATVTKDVGDNFMGCMQCGTCSGVCPWSGIAYFSPRQILRNISLETCTQVTVDTAAWNCATCGSCVEYCPRGIDIIDLVKSVRQQNVTAKKLPEMFTTPVKSLNKNQNPWGGKPQDRLAWAKDLDLPFFTPDKEWCLFTCCATAYDTSTSKGCEKAGPALAKLLTHARVSFGTIGDKESCCGDPAAAIGEKKTFSSLERKNTDLFIQSGVKKILTFSPHCMNTFKKYYKELKNVVDTVHYIELVDQLIAKGQLKLVSPVDRTVTYHDPCYLGRHNKIFDAPRRVLENIPKLKLVEMENNRERSLCCGGGGGGPWKTYPQGQQFGVVRVRQALKTHADIIATACPYCMRMLNMAIEELDVKNKIKVQDISELLLTSVEFFDHSGKTHTNILSLEQEDCHV
ncbi:MAG: 4Fe-4S dicluster domain-containing protein [Proteobacteria bacterium]|nr:4Fe-4S dicluster domain-containing protein [Pseudomonadota bacterium]MBU1581223.1 4Fe-4S dicluster domain-containing protein [Pseudomonadota bacterium]MBU2627986.1 4Fe-4S dicluster domain-containing protein [Pseudomonadota bacterium]